jgi:hypothetical protein
MDASEHDNFAERVNDAIGDGEVVATHELLVEWSARMTDDEIENLVGAWHSSLAMLRFVLADRRRRLREGSIVDPAKLN